MADHSHQLAPVTQVAQCLQSGIKRFGIQSAEPLVQKERIHPDLFARHLRKPQRQSQRNEKSFAAGKGFAVTDLIALIFIGYIYTQYFLLTAEQTVAATEFFQLPPAAIYFYWQ